MNKQKDYYKILGVAPTASLQEIKTAYRQLAQKHHPDVATDSDSVILFAEINEAYEVLSKPESRKTYDSSRSFAVVKDIKEHSRQVVDEYFMQFSTPQNTNT